MAARRYRGTAMTGMLALLASLACASSASAARGHEFAGSFGESCATAPCGPGQLKEPSGVAVNETTGDVYVFDEGDARIERFSATGVYEGQFDGSGKFEVLGEAEPEKEGEEAPTGAILPGAQPQTSGVAVDNSCALEELPEPKCKEEDPSNGDIYVVDRGHEVIDKFNARGEYLGQLTEAGGEAFFELGGVAVEASGTLLVYQALVVSGATGPNGAVYSFSDAAENAYLPPEATLPFRTGNFAPGLAVDGEGDFYLRGENAKAAQHFEIEKYDHSSNKLIERLDEEDSSAVAADQLSNNTFVDNITTVASFSPEGSELERVAVPGEHGAGLAVNASPTGPGAETLYVADSQANVIDIYPPQQVAPPSIESETISEVSGDSASFEAELNPRGAATSYRFEYGTCTTPSTCAASPYGHSAPVPDGQLGADFEIHTVSEHVQGLSANTTYHLRLSARNEAGAKTNEVAGKEVIFITQTPGGEVVLPDGRRWELVSPVDKRGATFSPISENGVSQASSSGDAISYLADSPIEAQPQGTYPGAQVLSTRGPGGWSSQNLSAPHDGATGVSIGTGLEFHFFTPDLSSSFLQPFGAFTPSISAEASESTAFKRSDYLNGNPSEHCQPASMNCYRPLVTGAPGVANVPGGTVFGEPGGCPKNAVCGPQFVDATPDGNHAVIASGTALTSTATEGKNLYSWSATALPADQLQLISRLPGAGGQPVSGATLGLENGNTRGAISADGSRIFWGAEPSPGAPALYMRDVPREETIELDAAEAKCEGEGECEGGGGRFQLASSDGAKVLFTDSHRLTANAGQAGKADLYQCEIIEGAGGEAECKLSDLTPQSSGQSAEVLGTLPGASEDAQWIYFVANGALTSVPDSQGEVAKTGNCAGNPPPSATCNLYLLHEGQVRLVSVLSIGDEHDWAPQGLQSMPARVAPNGQWLALMSQRSLTGYDNRDAATGARAAEVYLYSAEANRLTCASCMPSGARPVGVEYKKLQPGNGALVGGPGHIWEESAPVAANVPGWTADGEAGRATRHQPAYLTNEGRLYFNSADSLIPQDVNGTEDVYQYELPGIGGCTSESQSFTARSGGCVDLISSGNSSQESGFLDASESGGDVFFLSSAKLSPLDRDPSIDVYTAHECRSASPCPPEASTESPACDTGDSCKPAPTPQPELFGAPASALFQGAGNLPPPSTPSSAPKKPTRAELRAKALRSCHKRFAHAKKRRRACEATARRKFAAKGASVRKQRRAGQR